MGSPLKPSESSAPAGDALLIAKTTPLHLPHKRPLLWPPLYPVSFRNCSFNSDSCPNKIL